MWSIFVLPNPEDKALPPTPQERQEWLLHRRTSQKKPKSSGGNTLGTPTQNDPEYVVESGGRGVTWRSSRMNQNPHWFHEERGGGLRGARKKAPPRSKASEDVVAGNQNASAPIQKEPSPGQRIR
jgi:hypothetical protein